MAADQSGGGDAAAVVDRLIGAVEAHDYEGIEAVLAEDIVYDNVPIGVVNGRSEVSAVLRRTLDRADAVEWRVIRQVAVDDTVMNERLDRFEVGDRWIEIAVAGIFVVREGEVVLWRDYFDLETYRRQQSFAG